MSDAKYHLKLKRSYTTALSSNGVVALHHLECGASLEKKKSINCSMAFFLNFFPIIIPGTYFICFSHLLKALFLISGQNKKETNKSRKSGKDRNGKKRIHLLFHD